MENKKSSQAVANGIQTRLIIGVIVLIIIVIALVAFLTPASAKESFVFPPQPALPRMGWSRPALGSIISSASIQRFRSRPSFPGPTTGRGNITIPLCGNPYVYWAG